MSRIKIILLIIAFAVHRIDGHTVTRKRDLEVSYLETRNSHCDAEESKFQSLTVTALPECVTECALREYCAALNYHRDYKLCNLYQTNHWVSKTTDICSRVVKEDIHFSMSPCTEMPCPNGTACDRDTRTCRIKECLKVLILTNGKVVGSLRGVGHKIKYACDNGYELRKDSSEIATCREDRVWSTHGHCVMSAKRLNEECTIFINGDNCIDKNAACLHSVYTGGNICQCITDYGNNNGDLVGGSCIPLSPVCEDCEPIHHRCIGPNVRCVPYFNVNQCICNSGYEYVKTSGICVRVCWEYSTNVADFTGTNTLILEDVVTGRTAVSSFSECVHFCNLGYPEYLSISLIDKTICICRRFSESQYKTLNSVFG